MRTFATPGIEFADRTDCALIDRHPVTLAGIRAGVGQHPPEEGVGCRIGDLALGHCLRADLEGVPRRHGNTQLAFDCGSIELRAMRHLDDARAVTKCDR